MTQVESIQLGKNRVSVAKAHEWVSNYTAVGADPRVRKPYSFPAYDEFDTATDSAHLSDGDLLSPVLLNVSISIRAFYGLAALREELELALANSELDSSLAAASPEVVKAAVRPLYSVLDGPDRPQDVGVTKLSKLLHRKRPDFLVLHDKWVRQCYVGDAAPMPYSRTRSAAEYMDSIHQCIREDIINAGGFWGDLRAAIPAASGLSDVRLLDILAWSSRGESAE